MKDESTALVPTNEPAIEVPSVHLVARNPEEMKAAQSDLVQFLNFKLGTIEAEFKDLNAAISEARKNNWKYDALERARNKVAKQEEYYFKMLKAVEAGYTMIPDFPIDVFAIRVTRKGVRAQTQRRENSYNHPSIANEQPDMAAAGEGEYKNPSQLVRHYTHKEKRDGREVEVKTTTAADRQDEIVFPMIAARPVVMNATAEAMALKVFDQIGICRPVEHLEHSRTFAVSGSGDPLIIGQILRRRAGYQQPKVASFIIAWHVNLNDL